MKNIVLALLSLSFLTCQFEKPRKVFEGDEQFRVRVPSKIYFDNIRSASYYKRRQAKTNIDVYTHRKYSKWQKKPLIRAIIVHQWMKDEASVFLEKNNYPYFKNEFKIKWKSTQDSTSGILEIKRFSRQEQYEMAGKIYEKMLEKCQFSIENSKGQNLPIWAEGIDRAAFVATLQDYYKLTE